jgi:hypothetical protein
MPSGRELRLIGNLGACGFSSTVCEEVDRVSDGKKWFRFLAKTIGLMCLRRDKAQGVGRASGQDFVLERVNLRLAQYF